MTASGGKAAAHCPHDRAEARKRQGISGGFPGAFVQAQCVSCGRGLGGSIPLAHFPPGVQDYLSYWTRTPAPGKRRKDFLERYRRPDWKALRRQVFARDGCQCVLCGETATDVDHLTYERFGEERLEDLRALCSGCHMTVTEGRLG